MVAYLNPFTGAFLGCHGSLVASRLYSIANLFYQLGRGTPRTSGVVDCGALVKKEGMSTAQFRIFI